MRFTEGGVVATDADAGVAEEELDEECSQQKNDLLLRT